LDGCGVAVIPTAQPRSGIQLSPASRRAIFLWGLPLLFLGIFYFYPLYSIFRVGFLSGIQADTLTVEWGRIWRPLQFTLYQAVLSTLLTLLVGLPGAYLFARFKFPGKELLRVLTTIPFIMPTVVVAASFNALLGPRGLVNVGLMNLFDLDTAPIHFLNTLGAILLAHVFYNTAIVLRMVGNAWAQLDPRLEQAAQVLGANKLRTFLEVTIPLLLPVILAATLLVFLFDFTSFGVVLLLGGPRFATLEVEIYIQALHMLNLPLASLLSMIQLLFTLLLTVLYSKLSARAIVPVSPRDPSELVRAPRPGWERIIVTALVTLLLLLFVSPLASLAIRSVTRIEAVRGERGEVQTGFTLDYYRELFIDRRQTLFYVPPIDAARNSLLFATTTVGISVFLGFLSAYALNQPTRISRWLDPLILLPLGTSAVTLGLGFILVFARPVFAAGGFPVLLPVAHSLVAIPFLVRSLQPVLGSIPRQLHQAAAVLGASPLRIWREIDLPILTRALLVSATFAFTISLGEFGATTFLTRPEYPTMPIAIFRFLSLPGGLNYGQALAMATLLMLVTGLGILLIERIRIPSRAEF
jgi:thiamine transport system permease protein